LAGGVKKWFMFQVWRLQQVAAILTLVLLSLNLAFQMYNFMNWREGIFSTPYLAVPLLLLAITLVIWIVAVIWDLKMKMWREQMAVAMERNPYAKEKMNAKEIAQYSLIWLPIMDNLGKSDPEAKAHAESLRAWVNRALKDDAAARMEWEELLSYIRNHSDRLGELGKK